MEDKLKELIIKKVYHKDNAEEQLIEESKKVLALDGWKSEHKKQRNKIIITFDFDYEFFVQYILDRTNVYTLTKVINDQNIFTMTYEVSSRDKKLEYLRSFWQKKFYVRKGR